MGIPAEGVVRIERPLPPDGVPARITELWAWTAIDPLTDVEGIVAAKLSNGGGLPLVSGTKAIIERMGYLAERACRSAEEPRPVPRLRRFVPADE